MTTKAYAYVRTSSLANAGPDKDSDKRQLAAIQAYANSNDIRVVGTYYDVGVKGSDTIMERAGFKSMLDDAQLKNIPVVLVESPDRFARDLIVQLTGHELLTKCGIKLIPTTAPDYFLEDTPTAIMVRQILGAVAEFDKRNTVAKLKAARDRKSKLHGERIEGRRANPIAVEAAGCILRVHPNIGLRQLSRALHEQGFNSPGGQLYSTSSIRLIKQRALRMANTSEQKGVQSEMDAAFRL